MKVWNPSHIVKLYWTETNERQQLSSSKLGFLGTDPTLHTATVANVRSVNYQDTDKELAKLNATIKEYLSKG